MCIYLTNDQNLTYKSREHVFPAGIGGIKMLPRDYVSDQANTYFSKLETAFMRGSFISIVRRFEKIGHRGTNKIKDPVICFIDNCNDQGDFALGYISQGDFPNIPFLSIKGKEVGFIIPDTENYDSVFEATKDVLLKLNKDSKYCFIEGISFDKSNHLPDDQILVGVYNGKIFISAKKKEFINLQEITLTIKKAFDLFDKNKRKKEMQYGTFSFKAEENQDSARCYAKIGFNVLAYIKGKDYVLNPEFDNFRNWLTKKKHVYVNFKIASEVTNHLKSIYLPEKSHKCHIMQTNDKLVMFVSLFGRITYFFEIGTLTIEHKLEEPIIFVCDWENKKEGHLFDFIPLCEKPWEE